MPNNRHNELRLRKLQDLVVSHGGNGPQGVSGAFAGMLGDTLIVAGGCNFPEVPVTEKGQKVFYREIWGMRKPLEEGSQWKKLGELPKGVAYGVSATAQAGIICVGGKDNQESFRSTWLLKWNDSKTKVIVEELPEMPVTLDESAGGVMSQTVGGVTKQLMYVACGNVDGKASNRAFRLLLDETGKWEELPEVPETQVETGKGVGRVQPVAAVQSSATEARFYVMGGFRPKTPDAPCVMFSDGYAFNPRDGKWHPVADCIPDGESGPRSLVGAMCVPSGSHHLVVIGGVDRERFLSAVNHPEENPGYMLHEPEWYRFNKNLLVYHTITDSWVAEASFSEIARAGASVVSYQGKWFVVNGELKPGVRATDACVLEMVRLAKFGALNWTVLGCYLLGMLLLGFFFMWRTAGSDDFFKGGGRIPWWAAGISIYATMLSAITYMAIPAKAFATDWVYYPMQIMILVVSFPVICYYLPFFRRLNVTSAYEYLQLRFNYLARLMASLLFMSFMVARTALVLYLPSLALTAVTGIDIYTCIILMGLVTMVYCTMGGVEAVVWGDVIQGLILVVGAIFAAVFLVLHTGGGAEGFWQIATENQKLRLFDFALDPTRPVFWVIIVAGLANNLISYTSDQAVIQRYLTTKDEKSAGRGILMNGIMSMVISVAFYTIGTGLYTFFKTHPAELDFTLSNADTIFPFFMMSQLPPGVAGLLIAAIFAATMSTISSNINSISTAFSMDIYKRIFPQSADKQVLRVARVCCLVAGGAGVILALLMATWNILSLLDYFNTILGLLTSGLAGLFVMGIFFDRINARGALIGFLVSTAAVFAISVYTPLCFFLYGAIGLVLSVMIALIWSIFDPQTVSQPGLTWKLLEKKVDTDAVNVPDAL
ncbi:MAG: cyclically-permuted mutarotase family protein [Planctomycetia bacterium]|nr:cyclically-permuted mutarotase family protein [Planctomycetia bacterium]